MKVCDYCRSEKCFVIRIAVMKTEIRKGKEKQRTIICPEMDLCDNCLDLWNSRLGHTIQDFRQGEQNEKEKQ